jgi:hypothetical protein
MTDDRGQMTEGGFPATRHLGLPPATRNREMTESMTDDRGRIS